MKLLKVFKLVLVAAFLSSAPLSVFAATTGTVFNPGDGYGAVITGSTGVKDITGMGSKSANILMENSKYAKIDWSTLNIRSDEKLNFTLGQAGQVVLNNVASGISKFAGSLTSSGKAGHIIISNPNGMVIADGAMINTGASALTLTTHDAVFDESANKLTTDIAVKEESGYKYSNGINIGKVTIKTGGDFNVISSAIYVNGIAKATDITAGGKVRFISSDGVEFTPKVKMADADFTKTKLAFPTTDAIDLFKIYDTDEKVVEEDPYYPDGFSYLSNITINNSKLNKTDIQTYNDNAEIWVYGESTINNSTLTTNGKSANIYFDESTINNSKLTTSGMLADIKVHGASTINKSTLTANGKNAWIDISDGSTINNSTLATSGETGYITVFGGSTIINKSTLATSGENADIKVYRASTINNSTLTTNGKGAYIDIDNITINNSKITTSREDAYIKVYGASTIDKSTLTTSGVGAYINIDNSTINNSKLTTNWDYAGIYVNNGTINNSTLTTSGYGAYIDIDNSTINNSKLTTSGEEAEIYVNNSTINKSTLATSGEEADICVYGASTIDNSKLSTGGVYSSTTYINKSDSTDVIEVVQIGNNLMKIRADGTLEAAGDLTGYKKGKVNKNAYIAGKYASISIYGGSTIDNKSTLTTSGEDAYIAVYEGSTINNSTFTTNGVWSSIYLEDVTVDAPVGNATVSKTKSTFTTNGEYADIEIYSNIGTSKLYNTILTSNKGWIAVYGGSGGSVILDAVKLISNGYGCGVSIGDNVKINKSSITANNFGIVSISGADTVLDSSTITSTGVTVEDATLQGANTITVKAKGAFVGSLGLYNAKLASKKNAKNQETSKLNLKVASVKDYLNTIAILGGTYHGDVSITAGKNTAVMIGANGVNNSNTTGNSAIKILKSASDLGIANIGHDTNAAWDENSTDLLSHIEGISEAKVSDILSSLGSSLSDELKGANEVAFGSADGKYGDSTIFYNNLSISGGLLTQIQAAQVIGTLKSSGLTLIADSIINNTALVKFNKSGTDHTLAKNVVIYNSRINNKLPTW